MDGISYVGLADHRNALRPFGIKQTDRLSHLYLIGKTGVGKSSLIETLVLQDLEGGRGFALVDPHGDLAERVSAKARQGSYSRVRYFDATDPQNEYGYNPLKRVREDKIPLAVSGMLETLKKLWPDAWGVRMEHVLRNTLYVLLELDDARLPDILRMFWDDRWRREIVRKIGNRTVREFWLYEFEHYHYRQRADAVAPVQNKLGALLSDPTLYRVLVHPKQELSFRNTMDRSEGLIVNLAKGKLGEDSANLLGGLIVSTLGLAAFTRAEAQRRPPFFVYIDEFQSFTTLMLANMMSELRKYGVGLILAHQHLDQLEPEIRSAVVGNAGTLISFRLGGEDAPYLARELQPTFGVMDLLNLPNRRAYLRLMIDGSPSRPFSGITASLQELREAREPPY